MTPHGAAAICLLLTVLFGWPVGLAFVLLEYLVEG